MGVAFVVWRYLRSTPSASPSNPDERDPIIIKPVMATKGIGVWRALQIPGKEGRHHARLPPEPGRRRCGVLAGVRLH